jgi:hypothetical protein
MALLALSEAFFGLFTFYLSGGTGCEDLKQRLGNLTAVDGAAVKCQDDTERCSIGGDQGQTDKRLGLEIGQQFVVGELLTRAEPAGSGLAESQRDGCAAGQRIIGNTTYLAVDRGYQSFDAFYMAADKFSQVNSIRG